MNAARAMGLFLRTWRAECLDHAIILNERHPRWALTELVQYYNRYRPHRSFALHPPDGPVASSLERKVVRCRVLGGLIGHYCREVA